MKANEQGLTLEERIMFAVLGIILVIAIGVLTFNHFSSHERKLEEPNNTTETEKGEDKSIKDKEKTVKPVDTLKEESTDNSKIIIEGLPYIIETINSESLSKKNTTSNSTTKSKPITKTISNALEIKENEIDDSVGATGNGEVDDGVGSTDNGEVDEKAAYLDSSENLDWTFNSNIVKESYANEIIIIPTTVKLIDGQEKEATVEIRNASTGEREVIQNNEIVLPSGNYIYYYTCNNITKEMPLTVYNKLDSAKIVFASVKDTYSEYSEDLQFLIDNSTITNNENNYKINIKRERTINNIPLKVILSNPYNKVETSTNGIKVSNDNSITDLKNNEFIIWLDLNSISLTKNNKILLIVDELEYLFNFDISIENVTKEEHQEPEDNKEDNNKETNQEEIKTEEKDATQQPTVEKQPEEDNKTESKPIEFNEKKEQTTEDNKPVEQTDEKKEESSTEKKQEEKEEKKLVEEEKEESKVEENTPEINVEEETTTNSQVT